MVLCNIYAADPVPLFKEWVRDVWPSCNMDSFAEDVSNEAMNLPRPKPVGLQGNEVPMFIWVGERCGVTSVSSQGPLGEPFQMKILCCHHDCCAP